MFAPLKKLITGRGFKDVEQRIRFQIGISNTIIASGLFTIICVEKLQLIKYFGTDEALELAKQTIEPDFLDKLLKFSQDMWLTTFLALFTFAWYIFYRKAVNNEMDIIVQLYSRFKPPHDWENVVGRQWFPFLAIFLTVAFLGLAWFVDRIEIYCVVLVIINVLDIRGNTVIRQNLSKHFADERYLPSDSDLHKPFIMRRRAIAEEYWIRKPQLERIGLMMIAYMLAFLTIYSKDIIGVPIWKEISYAIVMVTIFFNEMTMIRWRRERDNELEKVELDQELADRQRTGELAQVCQPV